MTLSDVQGHSHIASLFQVRFLVQLHTPVECHCFTRHSAISMTVRLSLWHSYWKDAFSLNCAAIVERIKDTRDPFYRPPLPPQESESVDPGILTLMKRCWTEEPSERPTFDEITKTLKSINKGKLALFVVVHFYPRGASDARVIAMIVCVCVSVCHTQVLYQNG